MSNFYLQPNKELRETGLESGTYDVTVPKAASVADVFRTVIGLPSNNNWGNAGSWLRFTIITGSSSIYLKFRINRVNASGVIVESSGYCPEFAANASYYNVGVSKIWAAGSYDDRMELEMVWRNSVHSDIAITYSFDSDSLVYSSIRLKKLLDVNHIPGSTAISAALSEASSNRMRATVEGSTLVQAALEGKGRLQASAEGSTSFNAHLSLKVRLDALFQGATQVVGSLKAKMRAAAQVEGSTLFEAWMKARGKLAALVSSGTQLDSTLRGKGRIAGQADGATSVQSVLKARGRMEATVSGGTQFTAAADQSLRFSVAPGKYQVKGVEASILIHSRLVCASGGFQLHGSQVNILKVHTLQHRFEVKFRQITPAGDLDRLWSSASLPQYGRIVLGADVRLWRSLDYGYQFQEMTPAGSLNKGWSFIRSSLGGEVIMAGINQGRLYRSHDLGESFSEVRPFGDVDFEWRDAAFSEDGTLMLVGGYGGLAKSTDAGESFHQINPGSGSLQQWQTLSMSRNGRVAVAAVLSRRVYLSDDYLLSWREVRPFGDVNLNWYLAKVSDTGRYILLVARLTGHTAYSSDYGATWQELTPAPLEASKDFCSGDMCGNGEQIIIGAIDGRLYHSPFRGASFIELTQAGEVNRNWRTVAFAPDGSSFVAGVQSGRLYHFRPGIHHRSEGNIAKLAQHSILNTATAGYAMGSTPVKITWGLCLKTQAIAFVMKGTQVSFLQKSTPSFAMKILPPVVTSGLALVVDNLSLDVYPDTTLSVRFTNPMFNEVGSHSLPFTLPATSRNLIALGFPHRPESCSRVIHRELELQIFAQGLQILEGNLVITSADPRSIECYFKTGNGNFYSAIQDKSLKDIALGSSPLFVQQYDVYGFMKDSVYSRYPDMPFAMFPVVNEQYADGTPSEADWATVKVVNYWDIDIPADPQFSQYSTFTPYLYLPFVLDKLFPTFGHECRYNIFALHPELSTLVLYNSRSNFAYQGTPPPMQFHYGDYVQNYPISDFIRHLETMFCARLFVNDRLKSARLLLFKDLYNSPEAVPLKRIVSEIRKTPQPTYDSAVFRFVNDEVVYPEDDIRDITLGNYRGPIWPLPQMNNEYNDIIYNPNNDLYYHWKYDPQAGGQWEVYSRNIQTSYGEPLNSPLEFESEIFTLPMYYGPDTFFTASGNPTKYTRVLWPMAAHKGLLKYKSMEEPATDKFSPRLLFYRGACKDGSYPNNIYPLGTFDVMNAWKIQHPNPSALIPGANIALQWGGEYGLVENFYKEFLAWKMSGPDKLEFDAWLDITEVAALDFSKKYAIGNVHMFLDTVELNITPEGITPCRIVALKV